MLLCDNDLTMEGWNEWRRHIRKYSIEPKYTEPYSPFQNKADPISGNSRGWYGGIKISHKPRIDYETIWQTCVWTSDHSLRGHTGSKRMICVWTGTRLDARDHLRSWWWQWTETRLLAWPAEDFGGGDAAFLLSELARPIVRSTLWSLTPNKRADQRDKIRELRVRSSAPNKEKFWTKFNNQLGPEYKGRRAIIGKALYSLQSSRR